MTQEELNKLNDALVQAFADGDTERGYAIQALMPITEDSPYVFVGKLTGREAESRNEYQLYKDTTIDAYQKKHNVDLLHEILKKEAV
jgi:hypothetical protein